MQSVTFELQCEEKFMISYGRYGYHLQDIAEIEAMPKPLHPVQEMRLRVMKDEVAEYQAAHPEDRRGREDHQPQK